MANKFDPFNWICDIQYGIECKGGSSGSGSSTTTSTLQPNPTALAAYQQALGMAGNAASQPLQQYSGQLVAGFTPDQTSAMNTIDQSQGVAQPYINNAQGLIGQSTSPIWNNVQQFSPSSVSQYTNPYTQQVVGSSEAQMQNMDAQQQSALQGQAISSGAFGGDRAGVASAVLSGQQDLANNQTVAGLESQGYGQALSEFNTQQQSQLGAQEAQQYLEAQGAYGEAGLGSQAQNSALTGASAQLQSGALQQQLQQENLNVPYEEFQQQQAYPFQTSQYYANIAEGLGSGMGGYSSTTSPAASTASQLTGLGIGGLGLAGGALGSSNRGGGIGYKAGGGIRKLAAGGSSIGNGPLLSGDIANGVPDVSVSFIPTSGSSGGGHGSTIPGAPKTAQSQSSMPSASSLASAGKGLGSIGSSLFGGSSSDPSTFDTGLNGSMANNQTGVDNNFVNGAPDAGTDGGVNFANAGSTGTDAGGFLGSSGNAGFGNFSAPAASEGASEAGGDAASSGIFDSIGNLFHKGGFVPRHYDDGGTVGGVSPLMASSASQNPQQQTANSSYQNMSAEQLQQLVTRLPPGSVQAKTANSVLQQKRIMPNVGTQAAGGFSPQTSLPMAAQGNNFAIGGEVLPDVVSGVGDIVGAFFGDPGAGDQGVSVLSNADGGATKGAGVETQLLGSVEGKSHGEVEDDSSGTPGQGLNSIFDFNSDNNPITANTTSDPNVTSAQQQGQGVLGGNTTSQAGNLAASYFLKRGGFVPRYDDGGNVPTADDLQEQEAPIIAQGDAPAGGLSPSASNAPAMSKPNPWLSLAAAGFGMAAGQSPYAAANIGQGALAGIKNYGEQQNESDKVNTQNADNATRKQQLSDQAAYQKGELGISQQNADARADELHMMAQKLQKESAQDGAGKWQVEKDGNGNLVRANPTTGEYQQMGGQQQSPLGTASADGSLSIMPPTKASAKEDDVRLAKMDADPMNTKMPMATQSADTLIGILNRYDLQPWSGASSKANQIAMGAWTSDSTLAPEDYQQLQGAVGAMKSIAMANTKNVRNLNEFKAITAPADIMGGSTTSAKSQVYGLSALATQAQAYQEYMHAYKDQLGTLSGADVVWQQYLHENEPVTRDTKGNIIGVNNSALAPQTWAQYIKNAPTIYSQVMSGQRPLITSGGVSDDQTNSSQPTSRRAAPQMNASQLTQPARGDIPNPPSPQQLQQQQATQPQSGGFQVPDWAQGRNLQYSPSRGVFKDKSNGQMYDMSGKPLVNEVHDGSAEHILP